MGKKHKLYPPLKLIEEYAAIVPWEEMEKFRRLLKDIGNTWHDGGIHAGMGRL